jgi:hypothetical protein
MLDLLTDGLTKCTVEEAQDGIMLYVSSSMTISSSI